MVATNIPSMEDSLDLYSGDNIIFSPFLPNFACKFPRVIIVRTDDTKFMERAINIRTASIFVHRVDGSALEFLKKANKSFPNMTLYAKFTTKNNPKPNNSRVVVYINVKHMMKSVNRNMYFINGKHDAILHYTFCIIRIFFVYENLIHYMSSESMSIIHPNYISNNLP